jgi:hypothetical protein
VDAAGCLMARLTVFPALLTLAFLLVSFPLLLLGWFQPVPVLVLSALLAALVVPLGWRLVSGIWPASGEPGEPAWRTPWWTVIALVAVAVAFGVDQALYHSEFIIVTRDPASYMQFAAWIERHGSLPINPDPAAFGGRGTGISRLYFEGHAFFDVGGAIVPQFMAGLPMVLSVGFWAGGVNTALLMAPVLGAAGVLTFGGLVARLVGPRWAPLAALALAVSLPDQFTARSTYSEPLTQILFLGGVCLLVDALRAGGKGWRSAPRVLAAFAGLCLGANFLVRLDGPSDMLLLIPFCGFLLLRRRPQALPLLAGAIVGLAYGTVDGLVLSRPYLQVNISSVKPLTAAYIVVVALTALAVALLWRRGVPRVHPRLADAAAVVPFVVVVAFAIRPHVQKDFAKLSYAQLSLQWVYWYIGGFVIALATIGAAMLIRRCLRGQEPDWIAPVLIFGWTITEFLYRPGITPDQPWASRRLVPAVLPGFLLFAVWVVNRLVRYVRDRGRLPKGTAAVLAACSALGLLVPAATTTYDLRIHTAGGLRLTAGGWASQRVYTGEVAAVYGVCAAIPPNASVLIVDGTLADQMGEAVRGMCDVPVARLHGPRPKTVRVVIQGIERAGRRPVLLAPSEQDLKFYRNGIVRKVMALNTRQDQQVIMKPPTGSSGTSFDVWMWEAR